MRVEPELQGNPNSSTSNAPATVTRPAPALPRPLLMPAKTMASSVEVHSPKGCLATRGYSDSAVPSRRATAIQESENQGPTAQSPAGLINDVNGLGLQWTQTVHGKPRPNFQLPCFKTLGISSRLPDALLTPPDEAIVGFKPTIPPGLFARSSSFPPANMPKTPSPDRSDLATILGREPPTKEASGSAQPATVATGALDTVEEEGTGPMSSSSEDEDVDLAHKGWIVDAVEAAVANIDPNSASVVSVLCHSQPCPLPNNAREAEVTTAFHGLLSGIQNKIDSPYRSINITHAIPVKFSMGQIPNSPVTTPSVHNAGHAAPDYFSMQSNVFSNAVVAMGHQDALKTSVPSSPHPVVPPASMSVSLLERFIPPSSAEEYLHLFSTDGPSVLVDRLIELSPNGGSLIFIYPTKAGAATFANDYLGPLLHPLLRTMCSIHSLSMDFGAGVGSVGAVDQMLSYESMTRKISLLLRKLGRGTSTVHRITPKYTLLAHSKQSVNLDRKTGRKTWSDWWTHQESPRIRTVVERYLQRGQMVPMKVAGKTVTAATLVQEVLDGVREGRKYADYDIERRGVEVGVYVIKRTA